MVTLGQIQQAATDQPTLVIEDVVNIVGLVPNRDPQQAMSGLVSAILHGFSPDKASLTEPPPCSVACSGICWVSTIWFPNQGPKPSYP